MTDLAKLRHAVADLNWCCVADQGAEHPSFLYLLWPETNTAPADFAGKRILIGAVINENCSVDEMLAEAVIVAKEHNFDPVTGTFGA